MFESAEHIRSGGEEECLARRNPRRQPQYGNGGKPKKHPDRGQSGAKEKQGRGNGEAQSDENIHTRL